MDSLWPILIQFVFRLTFGVATAMSLTSPKWVNSGFYRIHLWVLMGLNVFAALVIYSQSRELDHLMGAANLLVTIAVVCAISSYVGAACWLYDKIPAGLMWLMLVAGLGLIGAVAAVPWPRSLAPAFLALQGAHLVSSGLLLGSGLTAMLLGHYYLNHPGMRLEPLRKLIICLGLAIGARAIVSGLGVSWWLQQPTDAGSTFGVFLAFRWLTGVVAPLPLAVMTWQTLKIPNTQSATGILYACDTLVFLGELMSELLSAQTGFPL